MNKEFSVIDLDVHFYLNDEQKHQMDGISPLQRKVLTH